jgi:hypothetical protein
MLDELNEAACRRLPLQLRQIFYQHSISNHAIHFKFKSDAQVIVVKILLNAPVGVRNKF